MLTRLGSTVREFVGGRYPKPSGYFFMRMSSSVIERINTHSSRSP